MTDKKSKRVVIINNIKSDTIDQAIFILKDEIGTKGMSFSEINASVEAQEIINSYIRQVERLRSKPVKKQKKAKPPTLLFLLLAATSVLCVGLSIAVFNLII
jgi:hypothetical protein